MEKKVKYWALSCIGAHKDKGIEVGKLFKQRPEFVTFDLATFFKFLLDLEGESLIEYMKDKSNPQFRITKKGQKQLEKYIKTADIKDFFCMPIDDTSDDEEEKEEK
ncbi:hypothetical protein ACFLZ6_00990 [Nanoarchaeota archaeon]